MATDLRLKVSAEKYQDTINKLNDKINSLKEMLASLRGKKEQIRANYTGPEATKGIQAIEVNEENVMTAISNLEAQRDKIQDYLDVLKATDITIQGTYNDAYSAAQSVFK